MANNRFNKQVTPKGYKMGGRVKKMGGGMMMMKKRPAMKKGGMSAGDKFNAKIKGMLDSYDDKTTPMKKDKIKEKLKARSKKAMGGALKPVDPKTQKGLSKLPTKVRNKMGFMKKGGKVK